LAGCDGGFFLLSRVWLSIGALQLVRAFGGLSIGSLLACLAGCDGGFLLF